MELGAVYLIAYRGVTDSEYFVFNRGNKVKDYGEGYNYTMTKKELKESIKGKIKNKGGLKFD